MTTQVTKAIEGLSIMATVRSHPLCYLSAK